MEILNHKKSIMDKNGFTFQVPDFSKRKGKRFLSSSLYTSPNGYLMNVSVYGDLDGKGTHVSIYANLKQGRYDSALNWPFLGEIKFTILNQLENKGYYSGNIQLSASDSAHVRDSWGFQQFIPHTALGCDAVKNTQYLKDDSLYFRVEVKVSDHKPWLECN